MNVKDHYENHLAKYYSWMFGDFNSKVSANESFFESHGIFPKKNKYALDLGCGNGYQSIALAKAGFKVIAVDISASLLQELKENAEGLDVNVIEADLIDFSSTTDIVPELIVCMGDTLTHLQSVETVVNLIQNSFHNLSEGGKLVLTFRDLTYELKGEHRFIPVRSSDSLIFTCFLEYFADHVKVHDIVHEKDQDSWTQKVSWYKKLRLSQKDVEDMLRSQGFEVVFSAVTKGFVELIAERP